MKELRAPILVVLAAFVLAMGIFVSSCEKQQPAEPATATPAPEVTEEIAQTTCPVMGGPINKNLYTEYEGKKVYFCCQGCVDEFKKDPEKYLSKLPQFQELSEN